MDALPGHALGPLQHGFGVHQFGAVPVLFQYPPTTLHRILSAVVWRVAQELDELADVISELHHSVEKLGAPTIALWPIVGLDL